MRTRVILLLVVILLLAGITALIILAKLGKLGTFASTNSRTITISGNIMSDSAGGTNFKTPVSGATITIQPFYDNKQPIPTVVKTTANSQGTYKTTFTFNPTVSPAYMVAVQESKDGYLTIERDLPIPTGSDAINDANFQTNKFPEGNTGTTASATTHTNANGTVYIPNQDCVIGKPLHPGDNDFPIYYHLGPYAGEKMNEVLFCVAIADASILDDHIDAIAAVASQIVALRKLTGLPFNPIIYLVKDMWAPGATAYIEPGCPAIVVDAENLDDISYILAIITHEFGHLVDWWKGISTPVKPVGRKIDVGPGCRENLKNSLVHCFSTTNPAFGDAFAITDWERYITGYATYNRQEMFAELFAGEFTNSARQQKLYDAIKNGQEYESFDGPDGLSDLQAIGEEAARYPVKFLINFKDKVVGYQIAFPDVPPDFGATMNTFIKGSKPKIHLTANLKESPVNIKPGTDVLFIWDVFPTLLATSCTTTIPGVSNPFDPFKIRYTELSAPPASVSYTMTCTNSNGSSTAEMIINVINGGSLIMTGNVTYCGNKVPGATLIFIYQAPGSSKFVTVTSTVNNNSQYHVLLPAGQYKASVSLVGKGVNTPAGLAVDINLFTNSPSHTLDLNF